jgi:hypothetical protein
VKAWISGLSQEDGKLVQELSEGYKLLETVISKFDDDSLVETLRTPI